MKKNENLVEEEKDLEKVRLVSASTEPVDKMDLVEYCQLLLKSGADFIHCDVMDGIAVEKLTYNERMLMVLRKKVPRNKLDIHLMTAGGSSTVKKYLKVKPYAITIQYDYFDNEKDFLRALKMISKAKIKVGVSLSPNVPLSYVTNYLKYIDLILVMGVVPGLGGQKLIESTLEKVKQVKTLKELLKKDLIISFDGGVNLKNAYKIFDAGADMVVSGSAIYKSFDRSYAIKALKLGEEPLIV